MAAKKKVKKKSKAKKKVIKKKAAEKKADTETKEPSADIRTVGKYALLITQKIDAEEVVKKLSAQITELTKPVLDYFQRQMIDQIAAGGRTLYLRRELHTTKSKDVSTGQACDQLVKIGLSEYVGDKVNTQGLGAYVRELEDGGESIADIQETFGGAFNVVEVFKIGSRKR